MSDKENIKVIISGGGTGGHIFPALSIADELKSRFPKAEILFVGAMGRMEMERVPAAGYEIIGLPVQGLKRKLTFENVKVLMDFVKSQKMARKIIKDFNPDIAIGVGGYASAPILRAASKMSIPCLLQEQNSYAGVTNKMLAKKAAVICVAYDKLERFFPAEKIIITGNPVRKIEMNSSLKTVAKTHFNLESNYPVVFVMGGSLGARTLNNAIVRNLELLGSSEVEVLWQTGKYYHKKLQEELKEKLPTNVKMFDFISRMDLAYNVADLFISRAGALSLSELSLVGKPSILVPSPNVSEDHQTKNALALVNAGAARMVKDIDAEEKLIVQALNLITDRKMLGKLGANAKKLAKPNAAKAIVDEALKLIKQ